MIIVRRAFEQVDDEIEANPKEKHRSEDWHLPSRIVVVPKGEPKTYSKLGRPGYPTSEF
jgi:hypothetical protein